MELKIGEQVIRPSKIGHKRFMLSLKKEHWPSFYRIIIGQGNLNGPAIRKWCNENIVGRWYTSDNNEVYYFEDANSAIHFKLRWHDAATKKEN